MNDDWVISINPIGVIEDAAPIKTNWRRFRAAARAESRPGSSNPPRGWARAGSLRPMSPCACHNFRDGQGLTCGEWS